MSLDDLKAHARRLAEEVLTQGDLSIARELFRADCRHHAPEAIAPGSEGIASWVTELRGAFPDLCAIVEDEIADGEHVVLRLTLSGTHKGEFRGVPPTEQRATWSHVEILRADADGRFTDRWSCWDQHVLLRQLGYGADDQADGARAPPGSSACRAPAEETRSATCDGSAAWAAIGPRPSVDEALRSDDANVDDRLPVAACHGEHTMQLTIDEYRSTDIVPLAWAAIGGGVLTAVLGIPLAPLQASSPIPTWLHALNALSHLLLLAGVVGLAQSGAPGKLFPASL